MKWLTEGLSSVSVSKSTESLVQVKIFSICLMQDLMQDLVPFHAKYLAEVWKILKYYVYGSQVSSV